MQFPVWPLFPVQHSLIGFAFATIGALAIAVIIIIPSTIKLIIFEAFEMFDLTMGYSCSCAVG